MTIGTLLIRKDCVHPIVVTRGFILLGFSCPLCSFTSIACEDSLQMMSGRTLNLVVWFLLKDFGQRTGATFCPGVTLAEVVGRTCSFSYCAREIQHAIRFASEVALRSHSHSLICVKCECGSIKLSGRLCRQSWTSLVCASQIHGAL